MPPRFGTDGLRGVANTELTPEIALALGRAAARELEGGAFLTGNDTRRSGGMLQAAFAAGADSEGRDVVDVGVIPTPGLAWLAAARQLPAAMISASHNPFSDNGIKLLGPGGTKLPIEVEVAIQGELDAGPGADTPGRAGEGVGVISSDKEAVSSYVDWLAGVVAGAVLPAGPVVVDCANGAASSVAPAVFERLGIDCVLTHCAPEGTNINAGCGSTHLGALAAEVVRLGAPLGVAFDGDADRMLAVDGAGNVVDGDHLLALFAADMKRAGTLSGDSVVITVMSNLGLRLALEAGGIAFVETPVGDRHVADALDAGGFVLGGEQSGHLIFHDHATTGDGILTSLKLLELLGRAGRPLSELAAEAMHRLPQVLTNVPVSEPSRLAGCRPVWEVAEEVDAELGSGGRVLLRPSGTESCIRVMVEAESEETAASFAGRIAEVVERELG